MLGRRLVWFGVGFGSGLDFVRLWLLGLGWMKVGLAWLCLARRCLFLTLVNPTPNLNPAPNPTGNVMTRWKSLPSGTVETEADGNHHWVRRSVRAAGASALDSPHVVKLLEQIRWVGRWVCQ